MIGQAEAVATAEGRPPMRLLYGLAKRFIAGETIAEALPKAERLARHGFRITLDHLGEDVIGRPAAEAAVRDYLQCLQALHAAGLERNISIKLTQIGLAFDPTVCRDNLSQIVAEAARVGGFVRVDMEGSAYTAATLEAVRAVHQALPPVGAVIQASLRRSPADVEELLAAGIGVRLCKGAYKESPAVAFPDKRDVDRQYAVLMARCLSAGGYHAIATHDEALIARTTTCARELGLRPDQFEFQMLLGIRETLQHRLLADGWRVRVYMPYGAAWLPYLLRRLRERKENLWFAVKNVLRN